MANSTMFAKKKAAKPTDEVLAEMTIYSTRQYDKFKILDGNRVVSKSHFRHLVASLSDKPELAATRPVLVNAKFEVVDGQHRLEACRALGLPIYYIKAANIDITTARLLNATQRGWSLKDFLDSYVASASPQYVKFAELQEEYPLPTTVLAIYCVGTQNDSITRNFRNGSFKIMKDKDLLTYRLESLKTLAPYVPFWNEQRFALAIHALLKTTDFDPNRLVDRLTHGAKIERQASTRDYLREIEKAYNYNMKTEVARLF